MSKHFYIVTVIITILNTTAYSQKIAPSLTNLIVLNNKITNEIEETSGLILFDNMLWTFNDSGGEACLFALNRYSHAIERKVYIDNAQNIDWEDITQDDNFIYIGDVGDNKGARQELHIYKVNKEYLLDKSNKKVSSELITFSYNDKRKPLKLSNSAYDCEAIIASNDSIFLFTKNWVHSKSDIYGFPTKQGKYSIERIKRIDSEGLITGACISPDKQYVFLIAYADYTPYMLCLDYSNFKIIGRYEYPQYAGYQTEAVCFAGKDTILISSEKTAVKPISILRTIIENK